MISCKDYVVDKKNELRNKLNFFRQKPHLCVIQIGNDAASNSYILGKAKDCNDVGIVFEHVHITEDVTEEELIEKIQELNSSDAVNGIIIQLPIPDKYNVEKLQNYISPEKDVDGFRRDSCFSPCTPKGIMDWLEYNGYNFEGKNVTVIGRSKIVGKPLVNMLIDAGATVTCCNSKTKNLIAHTCRADVVVSAVGKAKFLESSMFGHPDIIVDVGINRENGKLCGDVDYEKVSINLPHTYVTPVPGGVGLLTRVALLENIVEAFEL